MQIALKTEYAAEDVDVVRSGLIAANREMSGREAGYHPFVFHLIEPESGVPVGGAVGYGAFDWVYVELLYVPAELRGQGHGTRLMQAVEDFARARALIGIRLDTFDFQARPFYEKLGFTVFGTIDDHPRGGRRYFMSKRLIAAGLSAQEKVDGA